MLVFLVERRFQIKKKFALSHATKNHTNVVVLYIFKEDKFKDKSAQVWWLYKSLVNFKSDLSKFNINLQIVKSKTYDDFFKKLLKKKNFSIYWNKIYEPDYLKFDKNLSNKLKQKKINFNIFKGNILNEYQEIKKSDDTPFKVFTPFWRTAEKFYIDKIPGLEKKIKTNSKKINYFENTIAEKDILPKKNWFKKFEENWNPCELEATEKLNFFLNTKIKQYPNQRNIPSITGTSKLSPYIKNGQLHVETIWEETIKIKEKNIGKNKFLAEIGWREFGHSLINYFPHMIKGNYSKNLIIFHGKK